MDAPGPIGARSGTHHGNSPDKGRDLKQMSIRIRRLAIALAITLALCGLGGCGFINEKLAAGMSDAIPQWAGGLPADAPPRPGTAKYDEFMQERERKRLEPAATRDDVKPDTSSAENAVGREQSLHQSMNTTVLRPLRITRSSR